MTLAWLCPLWGRARPAIGALLRRGGDEANNALLLKNMATLEAEDRAAFYVAVVVLLEHADDPTPLIAEGRWHGRIATAPAAPAALAMTPCL